MSDGEPPSHAVLWPALLRVLRRPAEDRYPLASLEGHWGFFAPVAEQREVTTPQISLRRVIQCLIRVPRPVTNGALFPPKEPTQLNGGQLGPIH